MRTPVIMLAAAFLLFFCPAENRAEHPTESRTSPALPSQPLPLSNSPQIKEIKELLARIHYPENRIGTSIPSDSNLLQALGLYLQLAEDKDLNSDNISQVFAQLLPGPGISGIPAVPAMEILRIEKGLYFVGISAAKSGMPAALYLFSDTHYMKIASGEAGVSRAEAFRYNGDELCAVICKTPGAPHPVKDVLLLKKQAAGWRILWSSENREEWIADKFIKNLREDWSALRVEGTTRGIRKLDDPAYEQEVKNEPVRAYTAIWDRAGNAYIRRTNLNVEASVRDKLKEMEKSVQFSQ